MKRFLLFAGYDYYPFGGAEDFKGDFEDLWRAEAAGRDQLANSYLDWAHVLDQQERKYYVVYKDEPSREVEIK